MIQTNMEGWIRDHFPMITDPDLIREMSANGQIVDYAAGDIVMDYGSYISMVPLVIDGAIKVLREDEEGHELFLYYLQAGETCPASFTCCISRKRSFIKAVAEEDTRLLALPIQSVDDWITRFRNWKDFIMQAYDERIFELVLTIDSIAFMRMDERLIKYLEEKADATGTNILHSTHQEIADDLNASREAISRLLKQLEMKGLVRLGRNKIELTP